MSKKFIYSLLALILAISLMFFGQLRYFIHSVLIQSMYLPLLRSETLVRSLLSAKAERDSLSLELAYVIKNLSICKRTLYKKRRENDLNMTLAKWSGIPADAVAFEPLGIPAKLVLNKGQRYGVRKEKPVLAFGYLAGKTYEVSEKSSSAITLYNRKLKVAAVIPRSGVLGVFEGGSMELHYIPKWADVRVGDTVETSGIGSVFPYGIPIGIVEECDTTRSISGMFMRIKVKPFYDFTKKTVYVILR